MQFTYKRNFIIEIRKDYTNCLVNTITPFLYEGLKSFYNYALDTHNQILIKQQLDSSIASPGILKLFQSCLKEVPMLNSIAIENEIN